MHDYDLCYTNVAPIPGPVILIDPEKDVAIVVSDQRPRNIYIRLAPRKFVGLIIYDKQDRGTPNWSDRYRVNSMVNKVCNLLREEKVDLPIYGASGNMYRPIRMNYKKIMEAID